jgi:hypothetical protein
MIPYTIVTLEGKPISDVMWKPTTVVTKGGLPTGDAVVTTVWHHAQAGLFYNLRHFLPWHPRRNSVIHTVVLYTALCPHSSI